jgi:hypothetical protein
MNNIFNVSRFGRLFVKHTVEHYKSYVMSLTVLVAVMMLGGSFFIYMIKAPIDRGFQSAVFVGFMLLAGTIFTSTVFADFGDKKKAVTTLTLPASQFEKYLVAWLYSYLLFVMVYSTAFYLIAYFAVNIKHFPGHPAEIINIFRRPISEMFLLYAFLHSIAFLGAIFFEKLHFIKTAFVFFISLAIFILINKGILSILLEKDVMPTALFGNLRLMDNGHDVDINLTRQDDPFLLCVIAVLTVIIWLAAYYRLKEKQV